MGGLDPVPKRVDGNQPEIATCTLTPPASVSAQLRHMRKPRFGGHTVEREYVGDGLYNYRLIVNMTPPWRLF